MRTKPTKTPVMYRGLNAIDKRKTAAKTNPTINSQPFNPSLYKAIANAVNTNNEPTSGMDKTTKAGTPIIAKTVNCDFLIFRLKSGPET